MDGAVLFRSEGAVDRAVLFKSEDAVNEAIFRIPGTACYGILCLRRLFSGLRSGFSRPEGGPVWRFFFLLVLRHVFHRSLPYL